MHELVVSVMLFGSISLVSAALAVALTGGVQGLTRPRRAGVGGPVFADTPRRYEFREGYLLSPLDANDAFVPQDTDRSAAFDVLSRGLAPLNTDLPARLAALSGRGEAFVLTGRFGPDTLTIGGRAEADRLVITIGPAEGGGGRQVVDAPVLAALQAEAEDLRQALDLGRAPMWKEDAQGKIHWVNGPYLALVERLSGSGSGPGTGIWPVPNLFADQLDPLPEAGSLRRCRLTLPGPEGAAPSPADDQTLWFDVSVTRQADLALFCAAPIDRLVAAETALRNFVQTLSKTFAHLPIGLAIFDRRRELMLFNPALVTLSTLAPEFLSRRPRLVAFLDALRDRQRMPEPKNYRSWRDEIARLEQRAEEGTYQELWSLPNGQSLRVIGRPHPDGAVAFMFEDITSEISLTRKFRSDLELYQAVLDGTPDALAVFSGEGRLVLANEGCRRLWGMEPAGTIGVLSVAEATRLWQARCAPAGLWGDIRDFTIRGADRAGWSEEIVTLAGDPLVAQVEPLAGGAMAVRFAARDDQGDGAPDRDTALPAPPVARPAPPVRPAVLHELAEPAARFRSRRTPEG